MDEPNTSAELLTLLDALCNEQLTAAQHARLQELLRDDPSAQQTYFAYLDLHLGLKQTLALGPLPETPIDNPPGAAVKRAGQRARRMPRSRALAASLVTVACAAIAALLMMRLDSSPAQEAAHLIEVAGTVYLRAADGAALVASPGMPVSAGERIDARGQGALAILAYNDGTQLALVNESSATRLAGEGKSIVLHHGIVSAQIAPQPVGRPLLLATPGAKIEVVGTRFALAAATDRTALNVSEGRVRLTRVSDGQTVEVGQGQGVVTGGDAQLAVRETSGPREAWEADFEQGVPTGWVGSHVTTLLPRGSQGAIRAVFDNNSKPAVYLIAARDEWLEGLFAVHGDSHLHLTMKMERPDWLNVFLATRGGDPAKPTWTLHNFNEVPFWPPKAGEWRTITIPLSQFRRKRDGVFHNEPPTIGEVAYSLSISATEPDRGLVIDRMWVTRGGPGVVQTTPLP